MTPRESGACPNARPLPFEIIRFGGSETKKQKRRRFSLFAFATPSSLSSSSSRTFFFRSPSLSTFHFPLPPPSPLPLKPLALPLPTAIHALPSPSRPSLLAISRARSASAPLPRTPSSAASSFLPPAASSRRGRSLAPRRPPLRLPFRSGAPIGASAAACAGGLLRRVSALGLEAVLRSSRGSGEGSLVRVRDSRRLSASSMIAVEDITPEHAFKRILTSLPKPGGGEFGKFYSLPALNDPRVERPPYSLRIFLGSAIRNCDNFLVTKDDVERIIDWENTSPKQDEIPFKPAHVLLQDFTGVPAVVDLACMQDAMKDIGSDPENINPLVPVDLVVDHSVQRYKVAGQDIIILAGAEYGSGSSRDWAAKGLMLLGVKAVIAKSLERIHRSNLAGMWVIPLCFKPGEDADTLGLTGHERYTIDLPGKVSEVRPGQDVTVTTNTGKSFICTLRFDTKVELAYFDHGGIQPSVIRSLIKQ